jgi:hypothetical protein
MRSITKRAVASLASIATVFTLASPVSASNIGNEGCTPGYWKNHTTNWEEYTPSTQLKTIFTFPASLAGFGDQTLLTALQGGGGPGVDGATRILMRAASAAVLNAAHEGVGYPYRRFDEPFNIVAKVNAALASLDRQTMLTLAATLDAANNLGCPLN